MGNCFSKLRDGGGVRGGMEVGDGSGGGSKRKSHQLQNYNPVRYLSDQREIRNPNHVVSRVHFVAQTLLKNGGNHWVICLQTGPEEVICINMNPGEFLGAKVPGHGYRGRMDIVYQHDGINDDKEALITIPATQGHSAIHFINAIIDAGNHEYDFTTEGRGCTWWVLDQFHLFLHLGLIQHGFDVIETAVNQEWITGRPVKAWPATRGFYMRETRGGGWSRNSNGRGAGRSSGTSHQ